jgi:hypothetical protein
MQIAKMQLSVAQVQSNAIIVAHLAERRAVIRSLLASFQTL